MPTTIRQICENALQEINATAPGDSPSPEDIALAFKKLQLVFDDWNAIRAAVYATKYLTFTLVPNADPHTIGPTGANFTVTTGRPVEITGASLNLNNEDIFVPIAIRDYQWWAALSIPSLQVTFPTDLYYEPDWPLGKLHFYPVPTQAMEVRLEVRAVLASAALDLDDLWDLPQGYENAATLTTAEYCSVPLGKPISADLGKAANDARARIFGNNDQPRRIATRDAGMPRRSLSTDDWNYRTGLPISEG